MLNLLATLPAQAVETFDGRTYAWGDLHAHTGLSGDGGSSDLDNCTGSCGSLEAVFDTARDNALDFVAITDHINGGPDADADAWAEFVARALEENASGSIVTVPGAELWWRRSDLSAVGHRTLLMFADDSTLAGLTRADVRPTDAMSIESCGEIATYADDLASRFGQVMLLPHHPIVPIPMATDWSCVEPTYAPAVEVYSEHGSSLDIEDYDVPGAGVVADSSVHAALSTYGLRLGFVGGTDGHDSRPGDDCEIDTEHPTHLYGGSLTVVEQDEGEVFDRAAIGEAIAARRTWVTTGPRIPAHLSVSAGGVAVAAVGDEARVASSDTLEFRVTVPAEHAGAVLGASLVGADGTIALHDEGGGGFVVEVAGRDLPAWLYMAVELDAIASMGAVCDDGGDDREWTWSSPIFFEVSEDWDGDGYSGEIDDCDDRDASTFPGATETWYDGVDADCDGWSDFDQDRDGHDLGPDCDDEDPAIHPGAADPPYDGLDADCDGTDDNDRDRDGHAGALAGGDDCNDARADIHPGAADPPYDGVDQDCGGGDDHDADGDGFRAGRSGGPDCNDDDPEMHPGAIETWYDGIDQDCDGNDDFDFDRDGYRRGEDCDDADPTVGLCPRAAAPAACATGNAPGAWTAALVAALAAAIRGTRSRSATAR